MNEDPASFRRLKSPAVVVSQNSSGIMDSSEYVNFFSYNERGLSKSRNRAIKLATGEIALIADDDVLFCEDYEKKIKQAFAQFPDADIITFKILTPSGEPYKSYASSSFRHTRSSIFKVSSVEIAIRMDNLKKANIEFDENFGLGATFTSGEETIFLNDALSKGLKLYFVPEYIVSHPIESSGKVLDEKYFRSKGALIRRLYGSSIHLSLGFAFLFKQYLKPEKSISFFKAVKESIKGFNSITRF